MTPSKAYPDVAWEDILASTPSQRVRAVVREIDVAIGVTGDVPVCLVRHWLARAVAAARPDGWQSVPLDSLAAILASDLTKV